MCLTYLWDVNMTFQCSGAFLEADGATFTCMDPVPIGSGWTWGASVTHNFLHMQLLNFSSDTCVCVFVCFYELDWLHEFHFTSFLFVFSRGCFVSSERCIWMDCGSWRFSVSLWPRGDSRLQCAVNLCEVCSCLHVHELIQILSCVQRLMRWMLLNVFVLNAHDPRHTIGISVC